MFLYFCCKELSKRHSPPFSFLLLVLCTIYPRLACPFNSALSKCQTLLSLLLPSPIRPLYHVSSPRMSLFLLLLRHLKRSLSLLLPYFPRLSYYISPPRVSLYFCPHEVSSAPLTPSPFLHSSSIKRQASGVVRARLVVSDNSSDVTKSQASGWSVKFLEE